MLHIHGSHVDRHGWIALGLTFLVLFVALGIRLSFGTYVTAWEQTFGASRSQISIISSVSLLVYGLGMPVAGRLADRFGASAVFAWSAVLIGAGLIASSFASSVEQLVWFFGVIASLGFCGASSVTASIALIRWFPQRWGLAVGVSSCGIAAGGMFLSPLSLYLIRTFSWQQTLLLLGLICLLILSTVIWLFFKDAPPEQEQPSERSTQPFTPGAPVTPAWPIGLALALSVPYMVCGFTDLGLFSTHFVPLAEGRGISPHIVALALSIDAAANLCGNLITGHLADRVSLSVLLSVMYLWRAIGLALLLNVSGPAAILLFAAINGSVEASNIAPTAALCVKLYGRDKMGSVFGLLMAVHQFGAAAGAFLIGALYTRSHSYNSGLIISIAILAVGSALSLFTRRIYGAPPHSSAPVTNASR
jgi:MFS family permease